MKKEQLRGNIMLLTASLIWGTAFVAQSVGMDYVGIFTFSAVRSIIACAVLAPASLLFDRASGRRPSIWGTDDAAQRRKLLKSGLCCGVVLTAASLAQQAGIVYTTAGKAGFITALYIIIIPLCGVFFRKKVRALVWAAVFLALGGMYLLCMSGSFSLSKGDLLVLLAAFLFAGHIMVIDRVSSGLDGVRLSCIQFFVVALLSGVLMFIFEKPSLPSLLDCAMPLLYAGVLSSGVAYTLQILGQKRTEPVVASIMMSFESVFAALSGWALLGEALSLREFIGCALMFCAIIMAQLPGKKRSQAPLKAKP